MVFQHFILILLFGSITLGSQPPTIIPSEGFSPNDDSINDYWYIKNIELEPTNKVTIYNSLGITIWSSNNYDNSTVIFEGYSNQPTSTNNELLPMGTYYFTIELPNLIVVDGFFIMAL